MRIELPKEVERIGAVRVGAVQRVIELDSGLGKRKDRMHGAGLHQVPYGEMNAIMRKMAIVVPVKNERLKLIEGVLAAIPHACVIILVSNSPRAPVDRFAMEEDALREFNLFADKKTFVLHQKDETLARAFRKVGYDEILNAGGGIRDGKAEGMLIGTLIAHLAGKKYIGFVDADNYLPGSVEEYIREYAVGFSIGRARHTMVRIVWQSKPKISESRMFFRKWGRASATTNRFLNRLVSSYTGYETEIVKTGNAGEHAMTMDLAMALEYASGYAIETYHYVNLLEQFGGILEPRDPRLMQYKYEVYQIESRNPHLHEPGDYDHVKDLTLESLASIYHSPVCPGDLKGEIRKELARKKMLAPRKEPHRPHFFRRLSCIDSQKFLRAIKGTSYGEHLAARR